MSDIQVARNDGVVVVTIDRPARKNAFTSEMWVELAAICNEVSDRQDDRVLVLTGVGDSFCSGADLSGRDMGATTSGVSFDGLQRVSRCALALHGLEKPTIAAVNGVAVGAGCNLALACDIVLASETARFSEIFVRRGLTLDFGGSWLLPRLVGLHKAKELAFLGEVLDAQRAAEIGIVNRVVPPEQLAAIADDMARTLASLPPLALRVTKRALNSSFSVTMGEALVNEEIAQTLLFRADDTKEAVTAFLEKREGKYTGR